MPSLRKFLLENEAVVGIKSSSDYLYIKILRFALGVVRSWPYKEIGEYESKHLTTLLKWLYLSIFLLAFFGPVTYLAVNFNSIIFLEMGHIIVTIMFGVVDLVRFTTLTFSKKYRDVVKDFLTKFHLFFHKDQSDYAMKTHKQVHLVSHLYTLYLAIQSLLGLILFNMIPMYNNYSSGKFKAGGTQNSTFDHAVLISYPFNTSTNVYGYIFANIMNWVISYLCTTMCCIIDLLMSLMVFHIWGHFKILINNLDDFPRPTLKSHITLDDGSMISTEIYSEHETLQVSNKLKECIDYHRQIKTYTDRVSTVFGPALLVYTMFQLASGCILLLECSQMTAPALLRYVPVTVLVFQELIQLSSVIELVGSESEKLKDAVYGLPWECMDISNRKVVIFFLMNVKEPVHLKAMGIFDIGVSSMAQILKTSVTYFTFLRSI